MALDPSSLDQGQPSQHISQEVEVVIENYEIIVEHVNKIDPDWKNEKTKRILDAIFHSYIPKIQASISTDNEPREDDPITDDQIHDIEGKIEKLEAKKDGKELPKLDPEPAGHESHESLLVLLLSLAIELDKISVSDPRKDYRQSEVQQSDNQNTRGQKSGDQKPGDQKSEDQKAGGQNWGQLSGFFDYLKQFRFRALETRSNVISLHEGKPKSAYWPGLPFCVMALVPYEDSDRKRFGILVSASADRFQYCLTEQLQNLSLTKRELRLQNIERLCDEDRKNRITSLRKYSKLLTTWKSEQQEESKELEQKQRRVQEEVRAKMNFRKHNDRQKELFQELKMAQKQGDKQKEKVVESLKKEVSAKLAGINEKVNKEQKPLTEQLRKVKKEEPPNTPDPYVPVYLPVVVSTWQPTGEYLPTCLLDCHRFRFIRPLGAEKLETGYNSKNGTAIYPTTSCAEWDGFITWISKINHCKRPSP